MLDVLVERYDLTPEQAYILCSVAVDLKISQIVNSPHWTVSVFLPLGLFQ